MVLAGWDAEAEIAMRTSLARGDDGRGVVHIVGAGPGDPELLTLRALRLLQRADVILHDDLVAPAILDYARRDAELLPVGKRKGRHSHKQDEINALIVEHARAGKRVVRLKGGDPFVFGRGGEELAYVRAAGIEVFVVPGITAALGCAAASGIPLTHRDVAQSVIFVTAHGRDGEPDIAWRAAARPGTPPLSTWTLAGPACSRSVAGGGHPLSMPVAIVDRGTRPSARHHRHGGIARGAGGATCRRRTCPHHHRRGGRAGKRRPARSSRGGFVMSKAAKSTLQIATANRLRDGAVVFLATDGTWSTSLAEAQVSRTAADAQRLVAIANRDAATVIVGPALIAVTDHDGVVEPVDLRERIRANGLTINAIAADAVRYL